VPVEVLGPNNAPLGALKTDNSGRFTFTPTTRVRHTFVADSGDGHRTQCVVPMEELPETVGGPTAMPGDASTHTADALQAAIEAAVSREIRPLREEVNAYAQRVRVHDIVGGIGYIVGIAGLLVLIKGRGRRQP
jgi:nickel transport protein